MNTEIRTLPAQIRAKLDDKALPKLTGTAVVYNSQSQTLYDKRMGQFKEVILPGAFSKTLASNAEIKADVNHSQDQVIGRRSKGTLLVHDANDGLHVEISPPDTSWGRDAVAAVEHGDYDGMSFQFNINEGGEKWTRENGKNVRYLSDLNLQRVSVVADPAYTDTAVEIRSLAADTFYNETSDQIQRDLEILELS